MRIQHNIMAMNAYRNYNTNTSALSKNLEKLSSGYKINRAGDDAAGLAISEKMRAQITGLNAAQKNVKDGISLVKTAEGAMQEIQDMLNRMDYLATQSANGTYDDPVDRKNLQKEVEALQTEIDRIADSANFNGIKLLDGSLDPTATVGGKAAVTGTTEAATIASAGATLGVNTITHSEGPAAGAKGSEFSVDLHEVSFTAGAGESMKITLGTGANKTEIELKTVAAETNPMKGGAIAAAIAAGTTGNYKVYVNGDELAAGAKIQINGQDVTMSAGTNGRLSFVQDNPPTSDDEKITANMDVKIESGVNSASLTQPTSAAITSTQTADDGATGGTAKPEVYTLNLDNLDLDKAATLEITIGGKKMEIAVTDDEIAAKDTTPIDELVAGKLRTELAKAENKPADDADAGAWTVGGTGSTVTLTGTNNKAPATSLAGNATIAKKADPVTVSGDYNVQTTDVKQVDSVPTQRLASTVLTLDQSKIAEGNSIIIGNVEYSFSTAEADKGNANNKVYIGDMVGAGKTINLEEVARRISDSAAGNATWTVSAKAGKAGLTLVEKTDANGNATGNNVAKQNLAKQKLDLTTEDGIKATLGYKIGAKDAVAGTPGKALTLQIGDTSDSFNQLGVKVGDMHVKAMGTGTATVDGEEVKITKTISDIDIKTLDTAHEAINVIKNAINYVSSIRGDLGAVQNRLEHTANNLSVMAENIQDAESTIRDTDVAEEMMAYTKNNILVQSAQAMLAQANAVPQGVLQLLG